MKVFRNSYSSVDFNTELKIVVFWAVKPCYLVDIFTNILEEPVASNFMEDSSILNMEVNGECLPD